MNAVVNKPIYEPVKEYEEHFRGDMKKAAEDFFDEMTKSAGTDVAANNETVKHYNEIMADVKIRSKKVKWFKVLKIATIVATAILFVVAACLIYSMINAGSADFLNILFAVLCVVGGVGLIILLVKIINPKLKIMQSELASAESEGERVRAEALEQMATLNALFDWDMAAKVVNRVVPAIRINNRFNGSFFQMMSRNYGYFYDDDPDASVTDLETGYLYDFPFVRKRQLLYNMGTCDYTGSLTITWTTTEHDSEGNTYTQTHSEVLNATITKPKPYYRYSTALWYFHTALSKLTFSRSASGNTEMSDRQAARLAKKGAKEAKKVAKEAVKSGDGNFTAMANSEFEGLFGALDRNNEIEFRAMFTPLAQQNMVALIKKDDTFNYVKKGCANILYRNAEREWNRYCTPSFFRSHDHTASRNSFVNFCCAFFEELYSDISPLLSIPLYQQGSPSVSEESYKMFTTSEDIAEMMTNQFAQKVFAADNSATYAILKTVRRAASGKVDIYDVYAASFEAFDRIEYVSVRGGDGYFHDVPVNWVEYLPLQRQTAIAVTRFDTTESKFRSEMAGGTLGAIVSKYSSNGTASCLSGTLAIPLDENSDEQGLCDELNALLK